MELLTGSTGRVRFAGVQLETGWASRPVDAGCLGGLETAHGTFGERSCACASDRDGAEPVTETATIEAVAEYLNRPSCHIHHSPTGASARSHLGEVESGF